MTSGKEFEILSSLLVPVYKLSRENSQPENMCGIVFEKAKGCGGTVKRMSVYAEAADQRVQKVQKKKSALESLF